MVKVKLISPWMVRLIYDGKLDSSLIIDLQSEFDNWNENSLKRTKLGLKHAVSINEFAQNHANQLEKFLKKKLEEKLKERKEDHAALTEQIEHLEDALKSLE